MEQKLKKQLSKLPNKPGVYLFKNDKGKIIYIGKAASLKKRVASYFQKSARLHQDFGVAKEKMLTQIAKVDFQKTDSVIEAMILESEQIKKYQPKYNVLQKDDKSYLYVGISKEDYPRVFFLRGRDIAKSEIRSTKFETFGPYVSANALRQAMDIIRKIFPFRTCKKLPHKPCLWYQMYKIPAPCNFQMPKKEYQQIVQNLILFLKGKKKKVIGHLQKQMEAASKGQKFEQAAKFRNQIFALQHIQDIAVLKKEKEIKLPSRIECFDISNIGGKYGTGSMVVFKDGVADKDEYRRFKIKTVQKIDDLKMLQEIIKRRFNHLEWAIPDLILIDGGKGQLSAVIKVLKEFKLDIPIVAVAKGPQRKKTDLYLSVPSEKINLSKEKIIEIRNEAHRFAIKYHRLLRDKDFIK